MTRNERIADFCRAVLADNRPRVGEPWDTIANAINGSRRRAYRIGFENGRRTSGMEAGTGETEGLDPKGDSPVTNEDSADARNVSRNLSSNNSRKV